MASANKLDAMNDFKADVMKAFSPLRPYGFTCTHGSDSMVTLESDLVVMHVRYDRTRSFEVDVDIRSKHEGYDHLSFSLRDIYREANVPDAEKHRFCQTTDYAKVIQFLQETAVLLNRYAQPVLKGDRDAFQRLREDQARAAAEYTLSVNLGVDRKSAEAAWKVKDFDEYIRLMQPYQGHLSATDQKKLEYSLSHATKAAD